MAQALDNFFQRSRVSIQDTILRAIAEQIMPSMLAIGQTCLDWINAYPDKLSTAFADQFRQHIAHPELLTQQAGAQSAELQLVEDDRTGTPTGGRKSRQPADRSSEPRNAAVIQPPAGLESGHPGRL